MQILKSYLAVCLAAFVLATLSARADDTSTQAPPPTATSPQTITNKAEIKKQAEANAMAKKKAEKQAKAEAQAKKKAEAKARKEAEAQAKAEKNKPGQGAAKTQVEKEPPAVQPLESPPLPISADQEQRLEELLKKYKADQITPEQYQTERAKILAEH